MKDAELRAQLAQLISDSLVTTELSGDTVSTFSSELADNYIALVQEGHAARFGERVQALTERLMQLGVSVDLILATIDRCAELIRALRPKQRTITAFATSAAKINTAQAYVHTGHNTDSHLYYLIPQHHLTLQQIS